MIPFYSCSINDTILFLFTSDFFTSQPSRGGGGGGKDNFIIVNQRLFCCVFRTDEIKMPISYVDMKQTFLCI